MGTTVEECRAIVAAQRASGKVYMMMETVVYSREYLFVKELYDKGELGRIQFLRGSHQQDMAGWPGYWEGLPPMHYATHCVSPCLAILGAKHAESVVCHGSGRIDEALIPKYGSPFAIETATFTIKGTDVCAEVTRSLFNVGPAVPRELRRLRQQEELRVAASRERGAGHPHPRPARAPDPAAGSRCPTTRSRLPGPIQRFTTKGVYGEGEDHLSFTQGGGHGGSHPHLVHAWLMRHPRRAAPPARRRDLGQLDDGRHLCPRVGHEGGREDRDPGFLTNRRVVPHHSGSLTRIRHGGP